MNSKFYKEQARTALKENQKVFALCMLIMFFFSVPSLASRLAEVTSPMSAVLLFGIESVISVCLISVLQYSFSKMSLKALHNEFELFVLDLSFAGWILLEILTLGLLSLWVTPYHRISRAAFYKSLKKGTLNEENTEEAFEQKSVYNYASPDIPAGFDPVTNEIPPVCDKSENDE